jgi:hypothetical protein
MEVIMVYNNKFVVVVKAKGKILREQGDIVYVPFGTEYTIMLKNLNTKRAVATVTVDGSNVTSGYKLIVEPGETFELEGFMRGQSVSHKFKFIEKTKRIQKHRGNKICDGLIQVTFQFERRTNYFESKVMSDYDWYENAPIKYKTNNFYDPAAVPLNNNKYASNTVASCNLNDNGITVKGSESNQSFDTGSVGLLEPTKYNIVLQLKGALKKKKLKKLVTTKTKIQCETCGKKNKSSNKFCGECGTALFN